ncbi:MAG: hypothetical protein Q9201_007394 [Fulgogasparrea decipioides]
MSTEGNRGQHVHGRADSAGYDGRHRAVHSPGGHQRNPPNGQKQQQAQQQPAELSIENQISNLRRGTEMLRLQQGQQQQAINSLQRHVSQIQSAFATEQARLHHALRYGWGSASSTVAGQYPPVVAPGPPPAAGYPNYFTQAPYLSHPQPAFGVTPLAYTQPLVYQTPVTTQPLMVGDATNTTPQSTSTSSTEPSFPQGITKPKHPSPSKKRKQQERKARYEAEKDKASADIKTESDDMQPKESLGKQAKDTKLTTEEEWRARKSQPASRLERHGARFQRMKALITQFWEEADNERRELQAELAQLEKQTGDVASGKAKNAKEATAKKEKGDAAAPGPNALFD